MHENPGGHGPPAFRCRRPWLTANLFVLEVTKFSSNATKIPFVENKGQLY